MQKNLYLFGAFIAVKMDYDEEIPKASRIEDILSKVLQEALKERLSIAYENTRLGGNQQLNWI